MSTFKGFEDIEAWKKMRELVGRLYEVSGKGKFSRDFALKDQIRRAGISAMSNIAEGFEREGTKEFIQFLSIAKGSAGEIRSQLYAALDQDYLSEKEFAELAALAVEVSRMLSGLMSYLKSSNLRGTKSRRL